MYSLLYDGYWTGSLWRNVGTFRYSFGLLFWWDKSGLKSIIGEKTMKQVFISIQIDDIKLSQVEEIEDALEELLDNYPRRRIMINSQPLEGIPLPVAETTVE